ncbi:MAG: hypothetical protein AAGF20_02610 [Pseudomonadota bacterium]
MAASALPAAGDVIDQPRFEVPNLLVVWGAQDTPGTAPIVSDLIVQEGSAASTDLINGDVHTVTTGRLEALEETYAEGAGTALRVNRIRGGGRRNTRDNGDRITDASDQFAAFRLNDRTDVRTVRSEIESSFYVASNTAFNIDVVMTPLRGAVYNDFRRVRLRTRITRSGTDDGLSFGGAAQYPHSGNTNRAGVRNQGWRNMANLSVPRRVFTGDRRTARQVGTIADQSVRFDQTYRWNTGNIDLSEGVIDLQAELEYTIYIP